MATSNTVKSVAIGIAAVAAAYALLPALARVGRPLGRAAAKTGILLYEKARETVAELGEVIDDLVAEARAELTESEADESAAADAIKEVVEDLETDAR